MSVSLATIKQLFAYSCNECAHPDCEQKLVELDERTGRQVTYAEIAHIHGKKQGAERFSQEHYDDKSKLNGFDNLILLCPKHHTQIDQRGSGKEYTAEILTKWKTEHIMKHEAEVNREWVFGGDTLTYFFEGERHILHYWRSNAGEIKFYSEERLEQAKAAKDLSLQFMQLNTLLTTLDDISGEPADPSNLTKNDGYIKVLKEHAKQLKSGGASHTHQGEHESALHRLYGNLKKCRDIRLAELAEVGSKERMPSAKILIGETTQERIDQSLEDAKTEAKPKKP